MNLTFRSRLELFATAVVPALSAASGHEARAVVDLPLRSTD